MTFGDSWDFALWNSREIFAKTARAGRAGHREAVLVGFRDLGAPGFSSRV